MSVLRAQHALDYDRRKRNSLRQGDRSGDDPTFSANQSQWIALGIVAVLVVAVLALFTDTFRGRAVEVSVENRSDKPIFAYIDNTGRHGEGASVVRVDYKSGAKSPLGMIVQPNATRSLGIAVGLGDAPTLHVVNLTAAGSADDSQISDCPFDTLFWDRVQIPSRHATIRWMGGGCEQQRQPVGG